MRRYGRGMVWGGVVVLVAIVVAGVVALWPEDEEKPKIPVRAREYKPTQACLLTPASGLADAQSAQAWAGLQDASARTHVQVRYLAAAGEDTPGNAGPYLASLAVSGCQTVVVAGDTGVQAAVQEAHSFPKVQFLLLQGSQGSTPTTSAPAGGNTKTLTVTNPTEARAQVASELEQLTKG
ncbi:hypothetical protein ABT247_22650 [Kitasatospora sp. NPDC001539]|uniref:hypothetical protein n=1 Tax=Kitasatospora sp. NPDC001539 TaxID=3154384 RepID=UPI00331C1870